MALFIAPLALAFTLTSPDFKHMESIPKQFTCQGAELQPTLVWTGTPKGTQSFVLTVLDPDAPMGTYTHWVLYNIPANVSKLSPDSPQGIAGLTSKNTTAYVGPCPPSGRHHYHFTLYALDTQLTLKAPAALKEVEQAMQGHVLGTTVLTGMYP